MSERDADVCVRMYYIYSTYIPRLKRLNIKNTWLIYTVNNSEHPPYLTNQYLPGIPGNLWVDEWGEITGGNKPPLYCPPPSDIR